MNARVPAFRDRTGQQCQRVQQAIVAQAGLDLLHVQADEIQVKAREPRGLDGVSNDGFYQPLARVADRQADPEALARKFLNLGAKQRVASRLQISRLAFVQQGLNHLGLGQTLTAFRVGQQMVQLPPVAAAVVEKG
jgi:hypothetical protein